MTSLLMFTEDEEDFVSSFLLHIHMAMDKITRKFIAVGHGTEWHRDARESNCDLTWLDDVICALLPHSTLFRYVTRYDDDDAWLGIACITIPTQIE